MYKIDLEGEQLIMGFEKFSPKKYFDYKGYSIGFGHLIKEGEYFEEPITEAQAMDLLRGDLEQTEAYINSRIKPNILNQNQINALGSLVYNIPDSIHKGTIEDKINNFNFSEAIKTWEQYVYAGGEKNEGLKKRREIEIELFKKKVRTTLPSL